MKNCLTYVFVGILLVSLGSCAKNEGPDIDKDNLLVGTWNVTRAIEKEFVNGKLEETWDSNDGDAYEIDIDQLQFMSNGKIRVVGDDVEHTNGAYRLSNDGKKLTLEFDDDGDVDSEDFQIKKLTTSDLELFATDEEEYGGKTYRYEMEMHFKRAN